MTDQHTPGPWTHAGPSDIGRDGYSIYASGPLAYTAGPSDYGDAAEANARLIAAAPELLAALRDLIREKAASLGDPEDREWVRFADADPSGAWHSAYDAILKATGKGE
jgi:hypothetical protein